MKKSQNRGAKPLRHEDAPDGSMRATTCFQKESVKLFRDGEKKRKRTRLNSPDPSRVAQRLVTNEELLILLREDVIGNDGCSEGQL
jgi:hypothetical protein